MKLYIFNAEKLSDQLSNGQVSLADRADYVLVGTIVTILFNYSSLTFGNSIETWLGVVEFSLLLLITVYGFKRCFHNANGSENIFFVTDFLCLCLPIGVSTTLFAWGIYWGGWFIFQQVILKLTFESPNTADLYLWINNELPWPTLLLTVCLSNAIFYIRMSSYLLRIQTKRE